MSYAFFFDISKVGKYFIGLNPMKAWIFKALSPSVLIIDEVENILLQFMGLNPMKARMLLAFSFHIPQALSSNVL